MAGGLACYYSFRSFPDCRLLRLTRAVPQSFRHPAADRDSGMPLSQCEHAATAGKDLSGVKHRIRGMPGGVDAALPGIQPQPRSFSLCPDGSAGGNPLYQYRDAGEASLRDSDFDRDAWRRWDLPLERSDVERRRQDLWSGTGNRCNCNHSCRELQRLPGRATELSASSPRGDACVRPEPTECATPPKVGERCSYRLGEPSLLRHEICRTLEKIHDIEYIVIGGDR